MKDYESVLKQVLKRVKPENENQDKITKQLEKFNEALKKKGLKAKATIGGSYAKNTHLKDTHDVDVFIRFSLIHKSKDLSELTFDAIKSMKPERVHGSRDYFQLNKYGINYEIVPVLDISEPKQAQNVTDFSPWHVDYVNEHAKALKDDIRLAKQFCRAAKVYGAESYIRGFSGHVLDLLVIHYGGFIKLLEESVNWKPKVIIDMQDHYHGQVLRIMDKSKTEGPLILVDPVQYDRNAASALSKEKFFAFKRAAQNFLAVPSIEDFEERPLDLERIKTKKGTIVILEVHGTEGKKDIVGGKLLKIFEHVSRELEEFEAKEKGWEFEDKAFMWWSLTKKQLPLMMVREGPPENAMQHRDAFLDKYPKAFVKNHRLYARIKRKHTLPKEILDELKEDPYIKERSKKFVIKYVETNE